jgi:CubicO group peptidase (beta-lactamase class C family)
VAELDASYFIKNVGQAVMQFERGGYNPVDFGFSLERLSRVDRLLQALVDAERVAGVVALVLRDGVPVYRSTIGWSDREKGTRMEATSIFRVASMTKAVTSVAVMMLVEEGKIALGDPASRFIPAFARSTVAVTSEGSVALLPAQRPITVRDLLTHTSGISYGAEDHVAAQYNSKGLGAAGGSEWYTADKDEPMRATVERLASLPFVAQPGEKFIYGYSTDVLGCIVEEASGLALDEFARARITEPLGMKDTEFFLPDWKHERLAAVYSLGTDGRIVRAPEGRFGQGAYASGARRNFSGGSGLLSTAEDYAAFLEMIRNRGVLGRVRLLAPRTVELMTTNQIGSRYPDEGMGFGFGFSTTDRFGASGMEPVGGFGWGGAYGTWYRVIPAHRLVLLLMIQRLPNDDVLIDTRETFPTLVYQSLLT